MKRKPIIQLILFVLLVVTVYVAGFKLGQLQAHQRIIDAWNSNFGGEAEAVSTEMLTDDVQDPFGQDPFSGDPFGPNDVNDPFANHVGSRGRLFGGDVSGNGDDLPERLEANSAKE